MYLLYFAGEDFHLTVRRQADRLLRVVINSVSYADARDAVRAILTIQWPHTNVMRGPFLIRIARIFSGGALTFLPPPKKKLTTFSLVVVTFEPTRNVQKQPGKNLAVDRAPPGGGGPLPMIQPALL